MKDIRQGETMLLGQRYVDAIVCGGGLQLEIEPPAETLAQGRSPGFVDPATEWGVDHQLHPAAFVKKTLRDDRGLGWNVPQHDPPFQHILDQLLRARPIKAALQAEPGSGFHADRHVPPPSYRSQTDQPLTDFFSQHADLTQELCCTRPSHSAPKGD